jgi:hypothetical protein
MISSTGTALILADGTSSGGGGAAESGAAVNIHCVSVVEVETPSGTARVHLQPADRARAGLVLGHGAGGGVKAPDLIAASAAGHAEGVSVALVEQPYRVSGRRSPAPARMLDAAWIAVVACLREQELGGLPLLVGGRSSGARVACRTAGQIEAAGVLCLAFPLRPPHRTGATPPESRLGELEAVGVPTLVVQGKRDRFGIPPADGLRKVIEVDGDHSLKTDLPALMRAVRDWLAEVLA